MAEIPPRRGRKRTYGERLSAKAVARFLLTALCASLYGQVAYLMLK
ncbi:hypothetical protein [Paraburkholderia phytofirmans]|nr:hypothetical protein [Paraburkholderia phytofirmans]